LDLSASDFEFLSAKKSKGVREKTWTPFFLFGPKLMRGRVGERWRVLLFRRALGIGFRSRIFLVFLPVELGGFFFKHGKNEINDEEDGADRTAHPEKRVFLEITEPDHGRNDRNGKSDIFDFHGTLTFIASRANASPFLHNSTPILLRLFPMISIVAVRKKRAGNAKLSVVAASERD
jgi:hypothetical protein